MSRRKRFLQITAVLILLVGLGLATVATILHSDWGTNRLRLFLEETITRASGGRAEINELRFNLWTLRAEVGNFVLRGRESVAEPPLFRARRIAVNLSVLSWFGRKFRLDAVEVDAPFLRVALYEDGSTNLPQPDQQSDGPPATHRLIDLGIRRFTITDGLVELADQKLPLNVRGESLDLLLRYLSNLQRYDGQISARRLSFETSAIQPIPFDFQSKLTLERDDLGLTDGSFRYRDSNVDFSLALRDFRSPQIRVPFSGNVRIVDIHREFGLPVEPAGTASTKGEFAYQDGNWSLAGDVRGSGFGVRSGSIRVDDIRLQSRLELGPDALEFPELRVDALGGAVTGAASLRGGSDLRVSGRLVDLALDRVTRASGVGELAYHSAVSGDLHLTAAIGPQGITRSAVRADLLMRATGGENPLSGELKATFTQQDGSVRLEDSHLEFRNSHVRADGEIAAGLRIELSSRRLEDFLPALALATEQPESLIPVALESNGDITFRGLLRGDWHHPKLEGTLAARALRYEDHVVDAVSLHTQLDENGLSVADLTVRRGNLEGRGSLDLPLESWVPRRDAPLRANLTASAASLATILAETGYPELPLRGAMLAEIDVEGTLTAPIASLRARLRQGEIHGEPFDELAIEALYRDRELRLQEARLTQGSARLDAEGAYRHVAENPRDGEGSLRVKLQRLNLRDLRSLQTQDINATGQLRADSALAFRYRQDRLELTDLRGELHLEQIAYAGQPAGAISLQFGTQNGVTTAQLRGKLVDSTVEGQAAIALRDSLPTSGRLALNRLTLDSIRGWLPASMSEENLPVSMLLVSNVTFQGPLAEPQKIRAELTIDELRLARLAPRTRTLSQDRPFELSNAKPIRFLWDGKSLTVADAALSGTGTSLSLAGSVSPGQQRQQLNLRAKGDLNFRIFNAFEPSLEAGGSSELDLALRGTFANPDVYGTLDLKDASLYLVGVPNGLDKVNGRVFIYRDRATIEEITAQSGGGDLTLNGFVSYVSGTPNFRLSFRGEDVRVRYPPGVSTSANAALELTGSSEQSILSGAVTITRAAINPRSDLASILSSTAKPVATPSANQNEFLRNMRFDVQVRTAADVRFDSTLTQDLSGEADLRLRGNPYNPVLLGKVTVNQGEINFFGNKYFIDRGDISFINPLKLEPVLNLDLRTRVRSIDVTLTFSGPFDKLNVNYRSDPPLQLNEIIALLTVGRAPAGSPSLAEAQNEAAQSWQQVGASALVGQAVAAPIAGRLQKFFGVSRIKIDPRLTGVENNPQARLTVEQQVNRDITVTFITNLAGTQQQIVRLEWNFNPQFSMVALRDEDGLFGIDFLYRKRF